MHYFGIVLVEPGTEAEMDAAVRRLLRPHEEAYDEVTDTVSGFWDWWVFGGRWDGCVAGVDRLATCSCGRCPYGEQHDLLVSNYTPVREMGELRAFTLVLPDGLALHRETWDGESFVEEETWDRTLGGALLAHRDCVAVGVDYHR